MGWTNTWVGALVMLAILAVPVALVLWFMRRPPEVSSTDRTDEDTVAEQGKTMGPTGRVRSR